MDNIGRTDSKMARLNTSILLVSIAIPMACLYWPSSKHLWNIRLTIPSSLHNNILISYKQHRLSKNLKLPWVNWFDIWCSLSQSYSLLAIEIHTFGWKQANKMNEKSSKWEKFVFLPIVVWTYSELLITSKRFPAPRAYVRESSNEPRWW